MKIDLTRYPINEALAVARKEMDLAWSCELKRLKAAMVKDGFSGAALQKLLEREREAWNERRHNFLIELRSDLLSARQHSIHRSDAIH